MEQILVHLQAKNLAKGFNNKKYGCKSLSSARKLASLSSSLLILA